MKIKVMGMSSNMDVNGVKVITRLLDKFGYDHEIMHRVTQWGCQQVETYEWCLENRHKYTHFVRVVHL